MGPSRPVAAFENIRRVPARTTTTRSDRSPSEEQRGARGKRHRTTLAHELGSIGQVKSGEEGASGNDFRVSANEPSGGDVG